MELPGVSLVGRAKWLSHSTTCPQPTPTGASALLGSKSQIQLQLAELVWLKRWSEFVNFVPEVYPDLIVKKMSFNKCGS